MREYYNIIFKNSDEDDKKLLAAIENYDYLEVNNRYNTIDNRGVQIIVPYRIPNKPPGGYAPFPHSILLNLGKT